MIVQREAAEQIADIELIHHAVRQSVYYRLAGENMMIWGMIVIFGNISAQFLPAYSGWTWVSLDAVGLTATWLIGKRMRTRGYNSDWRIPTALVLFFGFGLLWSNGFGRFGPRELAAFWPTLFMFGYAVAGLWLGRAFVVLGLFTTTLVALGYFFVGAWIYLYLAIVNGGGLIICALWMRRA